MAESLEKARARLGASGTFAAVGSVTGTDQDPQNLEESVAVLEKAGVIVMPSNAQAVRLADRIMAKAGM